MILEGMTRWHAVGSGFLVALGIDLVAFICVLVGMVFDIALLAFSYMSVPWILLAGLVGGFIAGYRSASGLTGGSWHGLLVGAIGGLDIAIVITMFPSGMGRGGDLSIVLGFMGFLVFVIALLSVIAGGVGGTVHRRRTSAL